MNRPAVHPAIPIIIGVLTVATSAIFVKLTSASSGVTAFYRMFFSVLVMLPIFLRGYRHELRMLQRKDWIYSAVAGVFLAFHFILWFESLNYTSVASSTVLVTLQPIFALVGTALFFKETPTFQMIFATLIAISGSVLISWGDFQISGSALYGDLLALIACALITAYLLVGQDVRKRLSLITYTFIVYLISTITLFLYVVITNEKFYPYPSADWLWFLLLALLPNLLGHTLFNWAIKWVSTNVISIAILFEPIGASILAYFIFQETITNTQLAGGSIVLLGISLFLVDINRIKEKLFSKKT